MNDVGSALLLVMVFGFVGVILFLQNIEHAIEDLRTDLRVEEGSHERK